MNRRTSDKELISCIKILYPELNPYDAETLGKLTLDTVKKTFKSMALKNHPDRSKILGMDEAYLGKKFIEINDAYKKICEHIDSASREILKNYSFKSRRSTGTRQNSGNDDRSTEKGKAFETAMDNIYLPKKEVMIGQFLMYAGLISLNSLIEALFWQRKQRPSFGKIASEWKILTPFMIADILRNKKMNEKFGDCALRLKYITPLQQKAILCRQMRTQKKIGEFFIQTGKLDPDEIDEYIYLQKLHNKRIKGA